MIGRVDILRNSYTTTTGTPTDTRICSDKFFWSISSPDNGRLPNVLTPMWSSTDVLQNQ